MSHNPKLNVYIITLKPKNESFETFRDLFKEKYNCGTASDEDVFKKFFQNFLNEIGKDNFRKDTNAKKVIGTSKKEETNTDEGSNTQYSINPHFGTNIIEGIIDGGKYGILREYADIDDKDNKERLDGNKAVLDKFYILLNTPLNSRYGYLLIQSYTEETIQEPVKNMIKTLFCCENSFGNVLIEPFVPKKFVKKFEDQSRVRLFSYTTKIGLPEKLRDGNVIIKGQAFEIKIEIVPCDNELNPKSEELNQIIEEFNKDEFRDIKLENCKKKVFIEDTKNRRANFNIERELCSIRPTIYLEDEGITNNEETGMPDFEAIKTFCEGLLITIKEEFNRSTTINEI